MAPRSLAPTRAVLILIGLALVLPLCFLGYGNDIDVANVLRSGRTWLANGTYRPSRPPGAPVHELGTALLDRVGGSVAVALGSLAFGALAVWAVADLVRARTSVRPALTAGVLAANPWFVIAATSLNDATWALGLALGGCAATARGNRTLGAVLFGLATGCRASTLVLAVAWVVAERLGDRTTRPSWRASGWTVGVLGASATTCFVPSWWVAGRSLSFLDLDIDFVGWAAHLGRWGIKNLVVITVPGVVALALAVPSLLRSAARWSDDVTVRFAVGVIVAGELLFLRFPLKPVHLLPVVAGVALLVAGARRGILVTLVVAQLLGGLWSVRLVIPDVPDRATGGDVSVRMIAGPLLEDVRCRTRDRARGAWPPWHTPGAIGRSAANFACQNRAWRRDDPGPVEEVVRARPWAG